MGPPDTTTTVLGCPVAIPILVAPFAGDTRFHPDGYPAVVRACAEHGTVAVVPELTVGAARGRRGRGARRGAGLPAEPPRRRGRLRPPRRAAPRPPGSRRCASPSTRPSSASDGTPRRSAPRRRRTSRCGNFGPDSGIDVAEYFGHAQRLDRPTWTWTRLADAAAGVGLPYAVKGILGAADARAAVEAGAAAVYVSNHGGRQLDPAPATLDVLAEVVAEVGGEVEVLLDGGVTSGADAVTALALGARAVLIGARAAFGLAAAGQAGVARVLRSLSTSCAPR